MKILLPWISFEKKKKKKKKKKKTEKKKYYARKFNRSCETPYQLFFNKQNEFPIIRGALDEPVPFSAHKTKWY